MSKHQKKHSSAFKLKVALESLGELHTTSELAQKYGVHVTTIRDWRRLVKEEGSTVFDGKQNAGLKKSQEQDLASLHAKIGQLTMENDFLKKS